MTRTECCNHLINSRDLCITGLLMIPALVFNPGTYGRIVQFFLFWLFAWLSGKKQRPLLTIAVLISVTSFNLLVPYGRLLFSLGSFRITEGALLAGLHRAVTLEGLIMLSGAVIRRDLRLPGALGALIGESFSLFALLSGRKQLFDRKDILGSLDRLMLELSEETTPEPSPAGTAPTAANTQAAGFIILAAAVLLAWAPWLGMALYKQ
jgi:heptaprenyl diphosphate synthase